MIWNRFKSRPLGMLGLFVLTLFVLVALYAPFFASSKPLYVCYDGTSYFPLFRYLFSSQFFSKKIDLAFNMLGLFLPLYLLLPRFRAIVATLFVGCFILFGYFIQLDPANSVFLNTKKEALILRLTSKTNDGTKTRLRPILPSWDIELEYMNDYAKLNLVLESYNRRMTHEAIARTVDNPYTLYSQEMSRENEEVKALQHELEVQKEQYEQRMQEELLLKDKPQQRQKYLKLQEQNEEYEEKENRLQYLMDRRVWLDRNEALVTSIVLPLLSIHHWEDDVGGEQALNIKLPFTEDTRINRKDLLSALIFGSRISLFVGFAATFLALAIGVPLGLVSGYYGSTLDIAICRFVEVWEAMPVFFMLLLVVSILQTKSIFVVILVISIFSWMGSFRFIRAETFRQREMLYVDASKAIGFPDRTILLRHILPNSILAVLALLPFDIMAAVSREAALAFLGLGEEQSCSWGVLMDEGRAAFPADSDLLWPPAIVLTILLVAIASVGQSLQAALDPKTEE